MYALVREKDLSHDLSGEEWSYLKTRLPASKLPDRLRAHSLRGDKCTECVCIITSITS